MKIKLFTFSNQVDYLDSRIEIIQLPKSLKKIAKQLFIFSTSILPDQIVRKIFGEFKKELEVFISENYQHIYSNLTES